MSRILADYKDTVIALLVRVTRVGVETRPIVDAVRVSRIQLVIAVSEPTRFCVAIDAAPYAKVAERFGAGLFVALLDLGIPAEMAAAEIVAMTPMQLAASNSRSVLGSLNSSPGRRIAESTRVVRARQWN